MKEAQMNHSRRCVSGEHLIARRRFLEGLAVGGLSALALPAAAQQVHSNAQRVLVVELSGGVSQLESWDPKPGTRTGGPYRAIPTSVPGLHISELLPHTSLQMHRLALIRSVCTAEKDHERARYFMSTGYRRMTATDYPVLGAVCSKALNSDSAALPGHIKIMPGRYGGRGNDAAYLGPRYASVRLGNGQPPENSISSRDLSPESENSRQAFRRELDRRFANHRRTASTDIYTQSYEQAVSVMQSRGVFDVSKESEKDQQRYGKHDIGRHCLLARRLLENEVTFVHVAQRDYDSHNENFDFHFEQLGKFDQAFSCLVADLADRGMLETTLIIVLSEFGRTPEINPHCGRDHWSDAWSICLGGARVQPGAVVGRTNDLGTEVVDGQADYPKLFHTYLQALGLDSSALMEVGGRQVPMADPASSPIKELIL
jgi:hypothetical protein